MFTAEQLFFEDLGKRLVCLGITLAEADRRYLVICAGSPHFIIATEGPFASGFLRRKITEACGVFHQMKEIGRSDVRLEELVSLLERDVAAEIERIFAPVAPAAPPVSLGPPALTLIRGGRP